MGVSRRSRPARGRAAHGRPLSPHTAARLPPPRAPQPGRHFAHAPSLCLGPAQALPAGQSRSCRSAHAGGRCRAGLRRARPRALSLARGSGSLQTLPCARPPPGGPAPTAGAAAAPPARAGLRRGPWAMRSARRGGLRTGGAGGGEARRGEATPGLGVVGTAAAPSPTVGGRQPPLPSQAAAALRAVRESGLSPQLPESRPPQPCGAGAAPPVTSPTPGAGPARGSHLPRCCGAVPAVGTVRSGREGGGSPRQPLRCGGALPSRGSAAPVTLRNDLPRSARRGSASARAEPGPGGVSGGDRPRGARGAARCAPGGDGSREGRAGGAGGRSWRRFCRSAGGEALPWMGG